MKEKETRKEICARYRAKHPGRVKASRMKWLRANRQKQDAARDAWREKNKARDLATCAAYRASNPEKTKAAIKSWQVRNKDKKRAYFMAYYSRKFKNSTPVQIKEAKAKIIEMLKPVKTKCAYCSEWLETELMHVDHILALARGGPHSAENICMACPGCNFSKNDCILFTEWTPPKYLRPL